MPRKKFPMQTITNAKRVRPQGVFVFDELQHGEWYKGCETGYLYLFTYGNNGKRNLYRLNDKVDCTSRRSRSGWFRMVDVDIVVKDPGIE